MALSDSEMNLAQTEWVTLKNNVGDAISPDFALELWHWTIHFRIRRLTAGRWPVNRGLSRAREYSGIGVSEAEDNSWYLNKYDNICLT